MNTASLPGEAIEVAGWRVKNGRLPARAASGVKAAPTRIAPSFMESSGADCTPGDNGVKTLLRKPSV
jgi:hypothetical protein